MTTISTLYTARARRFNSERREQASGHGAPRGPAAAGAELSSVEAAVHRVLELSSFFFPLRGPRSHGPLAGAVGSRTLATHSHGHGDFPPDAVPRGGSSFCIQSTRNPQGAPVVLSLSLSLSLALSFSFSLSLSVG